MVINGFRAVSTEYTNAWLTFAAAETNDPDLLNVTGAVAQAGHNYASFLLGGVDSGVIGPVTEARLGQHGVGFFAQNPWKVTRRLTLDYGLRWDYSTYLKEQYGRIANFSPSTFNPTVGRPGGVEFEGSGPGRCNCQYARNYPYAFGPRLGVAYQITPKTVLRAGAAISYRKTGEDGYLSYSIGGLNNFATPTPDTAFFN
jgi:outer membrane receptor protein involved in Fe transport